MKKLIIGMLAIVSMHADRGLLKEAQAYQSILQSHEIAQWECAQLIYELVKTALQGVGSLDEGEQLYDHIKYIFSSSPMELLLKKGEAYTSVAQLYTLASYRARAMHDEQAALMLLIAAHQETQPWYKRHAFIVGCGVGIATSLLLGHYCGGCTKVAT